MIVSLILKCSEDDLDTDNNGFESQLSNIRKSIDNLDAALVFILAERFRCTDAVGLIKAQYKLTPTDSKREAFQKERLRQMATEANLDPDFAEGFLAFVIREVILHHKKIAGTGLM